MIHRLLVLLHRVCLLLRGISRGRRRRCSGGGAVTVVVAAGGGVVGLLGRRGSVPVLLLGLLGLGLLVGAVLLLLRGVVGLLWVGGGAVGVVVVAGGGFGVGGVGAVLLLRGLLLVGARRGGAVGVSWRGVVLARWGGVGRWLRGTVVVGHDG